MARARGEDPVYGERGGTRWISSRRFDHVPAGDPAAGTARTMNRFGAGPT